MKKAPTQVQEVSLAANLARAEAIKREMTSLLQELESKAAGKPIAKPGGWRHHPQKWAADNLPDSNRP